MSEQPITNQFKDGLSVDLDVTAMGTTSLTDAKNATFLTYNGNECVLQNDMGNTRLVYKSEIDGVQKEESVTLPEGYIPMGVKEYGGVIYFVLYNPKNNKTQIGSFPSPEFKTNDSQAYTGDQNTVEQSSTETEKLHSTNDKGDCINLVSGQSVNPTQAIQNYMFKGLNTAFISEFNPSTNDYKKRILRPKFINTSYQQDITDFLKAQVDFNSCIWHITVEGDTIDTSKIQVIDKNETGSRAIKKDKDYYKISFTYPSVDEGIMYKTYTTLYIPLVEKQSCKDEEDNNIEKYLPKYSSIECSLTPYKEFDKIYFEKLYEELLDEVKNNYKNGIEDLKNKYYTKCDETLINYLCKDLFYPNVKSGSLGMDLFYETVEGVYVRSKKDKQIYYRPVLMDPTPEDAGKTETDKDVLKKVEEQILSVRNDIINTFNESVTVTNNSYEDLVYGQYKTIYIEKERTSATSKSITGSTANTIVKPGITEIVGSNRIELIPINVYQIPLYLTSNPQTPIGYINVEYGYGDKEKTKKVLKEDDSTAGLGKYSTYKYELRLDFSSSLKKYIYSINIDELVFHQPSDVKVDNIKFNYTVEKLNSNYISQPQTITIDYKDEASGVYSLANEGLPEWYAYPLNINIPLKSDDSSTQTSNICFAAKTKQGIAYGKMFQIKTDTFTLPSNKVEIPSTVPSTGGNVSAKSMTRANTDFSQLFDTVPTVPGAQKETIPKGDATLNTIDITSISIVDYDKYNKQFQIKTYSPEAIADKNFKITYGWECYNNGYDIDLSYLNLDGLEFDASKEYSTYIGACLWEDKELSWNDDTLALLKNYRIGDDDQTFNLDSINSSDYCIDINNTILYEKYFKDTISEQNIDYIETTQSIVDKDKDYKEKQFVNISNDECHQDDFLKGNSCVFELFDDRDIYGSAKSWETKDDFTYKKEKSLSLLKLDYQPYLLDIYKRNYNVCINRFDDLFLYNLFNTELKINQDIDSYLYFNIKYDDIPGRNERKVNIISYINWGGEYNTRALVNSGNNDQFVNGFTEKYDQMTPDTLRVALNMMKTGDTIKHDDGIWGTYYYKYKEQYYDKSTYTKGNGFVYKKTISDSIPINGSTSQGINIYNYLDKGPLLKKLIIWLLFTRRNSINKKVEPENTKNLNGLQNGIQVSIKSTKNEAKFQLSNPHFNLSHYKSFIDGKSYDDIIKLAYIIYGTQNKIYLDLWNNINNEYDVTAITSLSPVSGLFDHDPNWMDFRINPKDSSYRSCLYENEIFNRIHLFRDDTGKRFLNLKKWFDSGKTYLISFYALKEDMTKSDSPYLDIRATQNEVASGEEDVIEAQYCMLTSYDGNDYGYKEDKFKHFIVTTNDILSDKYDNQQMMKFNYVRVSFLVRNDSQNFYLGLGPTDDCRIRIRNLVAVELKDNFEDSKCYLHAPRAKIEDTSNFLENATVGNTKLSTLWQDTQVLPYPFYDITETF